MQHDNENDPLPFLTLAAITANVTRFLIKRDQKATDEREDEQRETDERAEAKSQRREFLVAGVHA